MDPHVATAAISVAGSVALGALSLARQIYRQRSSSLAQILKAVKRHPVLRLEEDEALVVNCNDPVKAGLMNAIRSNVVCRPIKHELQKFLARVEGKDSPDSEFVEEGVAILRDQLFHRQRAAAAEFPATIHSIIRRLLDLLQNSLATTSDLFRSSYDLGQVLELVFNVFYVSSFAALSQWAQTANQINGQLNGLSWDGRRIGYSFNGAVADVLRVLDPAMALMHEALRETDSCAFLVNDRGAVVGCVGTKNAFGYAEKTLTSMTLSVLQLGIEGLAPKDDLKLFQAELGRNSNDESMCRSLPVKSLDDSTWETIIFAVRIFLNYESNTHKISLVLFVRNRQLDRYEAGAEKETRDFEDTHTRLAFLMSALTNPARRVAVGCSLDGDSSLEVRAVLDDYGSDLPHFERGQHLHDQMQLHPRRLQDMCKRCELRLQNDLLRSASLSYTWQSTAIVAEFYLIGKTQSAVMTLHCATVPIAKFTTTLRRASTTPALNARRELGGCASWLRAAVHKWTSRRK